MSWHDPRWQRPDKARYFLRMNASLGFLLAEAARGLFAAPPPGESPLARAAPCPGPQFDGRGALRPCECDTLATATWRQRTQALTSLSGDPVLDKYNLALVEAAAAREAARRGVGVEPPSQCSLLDAEEAPAACPPRGRSGCCASGRLLPVDTVQMFEQPQGSGAFRWAREIWDLRTMLLPVRRAAAAAAVASDEQTAATRSRVGAQGQPPPPTTARAAHQTDEALLARLRRRHVRLRGADAVRSCEEGPASQCLVCNGSRLESLLSRKQTKDCNAPSRILHLLSG